MMKSQPEPAPLRLLKWSFPLLALLLAILMGWAMLQPAGPHFPSGSPVALPSGIVDNPVTAVLLVFRAYDTLLELGVLLLAVMAVWTLGEVADPAPPSEDPILNTLVWALLPLLVLTAAYLVWIGSKEPGGAFQGGALLGAAGVLLLLIGRPLPAICPAFLNRLFLGLGLAIFLVIGLGSLAAPSGLFLDYPPKMASRLILLIETAAAVSIGISLVCLVSGAKAGRD